MKRFLTQLARKGTAALLATVIIGASTGYLAPPKARAIDYEHFNTVVNAVSKAANVDTAAGIQALVAKEYVFDKIAFTVARMALNEIRKSTIRWINSGFEGNPAFVTDLGGFLRDRADKIAGDIIYGSELNALCAPIELDVRLALELSQAPTIEEQVQCTLSDVVSNVEGFIDGTTQENYLPAWFELTMNPRNNFYGAYAAAKRAVDAEVEAEIQIARDKLAWSGGFYSKEECLAVGINGEEECIITMPGVAIAEALKVEIGNSSEALLTADEINEVVSALFAQLTQQALTGAGGLLGLTRTGGSYGNTSYIDRMGSAQFDSTDPSARTGSDRFLGDAIADESQYRALYAGVVSRAEAIMVQVSSNSCASAGSVRAQVQPILDEALTAQNAADANLAQLRNLQVRYDAAVNNPEAQQDIVAEYQQLQAQRVLHTSITIAEDEFRVNDLKGRLDSIASQIPRSCGGTGTGTESED